MPAGYTGTYCQTFDLCLGVECAATQVCEEGVCNCLSGYENAFDGDTCSQEKRTKYLGNYLSDHQCVGEYAVSIVPNVSDLDKFDLINFRNLADTLTLDISNANSLQFTGALLGKLVKTFSFSTWQTGTIDTGTGVVQIIYAATVQGSPTTACTLTLTPQ